MYDVAIIGAGMAGMATAARLQAGGYSTVVLESHALAGGCAGFYRRKGFSFDVGATTLVDFDPGGVGGQFLDAIGVGSLDAEHLPGYIACGPTPLSQTSTLRGRIIPALFLELTYHLEHHLYPQVPSHNLPKLSRRLDPFLRQAGVRPRKVP